VPRYREVQSESDLMGARASPYSFAVPYRQFHSLVVSLSDIQDRIFMSYMPVIWHLKRYRLGNYFYTIAI